MKKIVCPKCGEESAIPEWNKKTDKFYSPFYPVKNPNEMQIEVISENDFDENGFCTKGDRNSCEVTMYVCPKCSAEIYSHALKMVDVTEKDDNSSRLACPKCNSTVCGREPSDFRECRIKDKHDYEQWLREYV